MHDALKRQLIETIETGDAQQVEQFVLDHFTEFPEELQGKILANFFVNAAGKVDPEEAIRAMQQEGLSLLEKLEALKASLEQKE